MSKPFDSLAPAKQAFGRRKSLQLPHKFDVPIPPSLLQSPYLTSPESIFQRNVSPHKHPSEEDEQWLQDTVPLSLDDRDDAKKRGRLSMSSTSSSQSHTSDDPNHAQFSRPNQQPLSYNPSSPPLVRWRHQIHLAPPSYPGQIKVHSAPCAVQPDRDYFDAT